MPVGGSILTPVITWAEIKDGKCNDCYIANFSCGEITKVSVLRRKPGCLNAGSSRKKQVKWLRF